MEKYNNTRDQNGFIMIFVSLLIAVISYFALTEFQTEVHMKQAKTIELKQQARQHGVALTELLEQLVTTEQLTYIDPMSGALLTRSGPKSYPGMATRNGVIGVLPDGRPIRPPRNPQEPFEFAQGIVFPHDFRSYRGGHGSDVEFDECLEPLPNYTTSYPPKSLVNADLYDIYMVPTTGAGNFGVSKWKYLPTLSLGGSRVSILCVKGDVKNVMNPDQFDACTDAEAADPNGSAPPNGQFLSHLIIETFVGSAADPNRPLGIKTKTISKYYQNGNLHKVKNAAVVLPIIPSIVPNPSCPDPGECGHWPRVSCAVNSNSGRPYLFICPGTGSCPPPDPPPECSGCGGGGGGMGCFTPCFNDCRNAKYNSLPDPKPDWNTVTPDAGCVSACHLTCCPFLNADGSCRDQGCFEQDIPITLADGTTRTARTLKKSDLVLNPVTGKAMGIRQIRIGGEPYSPMYEVTLNDQTIVVSELHPFPVVLADGRRVIKQAQDLKVSDMILGVDRIYHPLQAVKKLPIDKKAVVYNVLLDTDSKEPKDHMLLANGIISGDLYVQGLLEKREFHLFADFGAPRYDEEFIAVDDED